MKAKKIIALMLALVLACAVLVACNDKNTEEYVGVIRGDASRGWKQTADPDPNNPFDVDSMQRDYRDPIYEYKGESMCITFTNSETLNNLFYDYTLDDFDKSKFKRVYEKKSYIDHLQEARDEYKKDKTSEKLKDYIRTIYLELVNPSRENVLEYIDEFKKDKGVLWAEPVLSGSGIGWSATTNDTQLRNQTTLFNKIKLFDAWDITTGSASVKVGVVDTGIHKNHPDLTANVSTSLGLGSKRTNDPFAIGTSQYHGTVAAGVIGAVGNNGIGVSGVCQQVTLVSLRADGNEWSSEQRMYLEDADCVTDAIEYATSHNIPILNFSGGFYSARINGTQQQKMRNAIQNYQGLLVTAAGNEKYNIVDENGSGTKLYPQSFNLDNILVVGATDGSDEKWDYGKDGSNYGSTVVDLFAPGTDIYSTYSYDRSGTVQNTYDSFSGTSLAAPLVAGVAALLLSMEPNLSASQLKSRIMQSVDTVSALSNLCVSGGRLNAKKAVDTHGHNRATCTYTNLGFRAGHRANCDFCNYTDTESHDWSPVNVPGTPIVKYHVCTKCFAKTEIMEIPHPSALFTADTLALIGAKEAQTTGDFDIEISEYVAIIKRDGKYYLMVACDDKGNRLADLSKVVKREEKI